MECLRGQPFRVSAYPAPQQLGSLPLTNILFSRERQCGREFSNDGQLTTGNVSRSTRWTRAASKQARERERERSALTMFLAFK